MPARLAAASVYPRTCLRNMRALFHVVVAKPFFILKVRDPLRVAGNVTTSEPPPPPHTEYGGRVRSCGIGGSIGALPNREVGSGAVGHVAAREPS
jgi:hypothetical protein